MRRMSLLLCLCFSLLFQLWSLSASFADCQGQLPESKTRGQQNQPSKKVYNEASQHLIIHPNTIGMCWAEKAPDPDTLLKDVRSGNNPECPKEAVWDANSDYFRAGQIVIAIVVRKSEEETFIADVKGQQIAEVPEIRTGTLLALETNKVAPIELFLGQWGSSTYVSFQVKSAPDAKSAVFQGNFEVHRFYRANIVAGFVASSLHTREYGVATTAQLDANGKPVVGANGAPVFNTTPVVGAARRPQLHPYVGVDWYFKAQDFFPGKGHFFRPGLMFGYGLDEVNSFFLGPNIETRWGLDIGGGMHVGRESFLAPGIEPGPNGTHLPDASKLPPLVNRTRIGIYGT